MAHSDFIILLARQRSGTHAVRSVLESHPDIFGVEEIFHLKNARDPGTGETNFFEFLKHHAGEDVLKLLPVNYEHLFLEYLNYLRRFTTKRFLVLDVKYNTVHHVTRSFQALVGIPHLFSVMVRHRLRTFVLTRRNYLRAWVSILKTRNTERFHVRNDGAPQADSKVRISVPDMLSEFRNWRAEDELVRTSFPTVASWEQFDYSPLYFTWDYADLFGPSGETAPEFRRQFANWLRVSDDFSSRPGFQKLSSLPLRETIENYDEVARALRDSEFKHLLEDEPGYRAMARRQAGLRSWFGRRPFAPAAAKVGS